MRFWLKPIYTTFFNIEFEISLNKSLHLNKIHEIHRKSFIFLFRTKQLPSLSKKYRNLLNYEYLYKEVVTLKQLVFYSFKMNSQKCE